MEKTNEMLMKPFSKALSELNNPYIKEAQSNGKKVIGLFCSYMPLGAYSRRRHGPVPD